MHLTKKRENICILTRNKSKREMGKNIDVLKIIGTEIQLLQT